VCNSTFVFFFLIYLVTTIKCSPGIIAIIMNSSERTRTRGTFRMSAQEEGWRKKAHLECGFQQGKGSPQNQVQRLSLIPLPPW
jgi:hypothetical protein